MPCMLLPPPRQVPLILYTLYPPDAKDTPDAPMAARKELEKLGPLSLDEKITAGGAVGVGVLGV